MQETTFAQLETMFLALGDKTRLRLLALMADGPVAVGFLADRLQESQPKVSRHLAYLRNAGMVTTSRDGKWVYYGIRYPRDAAQRRILESLISSIAVLRIDGKDVYLTENDLAEEENLETHGKTFMREEGVDTYAGTGRNDERAAGDDGELDIFML